jgi:hypothetical protein
MTPTELGEDIGERNNERMIYSPRDVLLRRWKRRDLVRKHCLPGSLHHRLILIPKTSRDPLPVGTPSCSSSGRTPSYYRHGQCCGFCSTFEDDLYARAGLPCSSCALSTDLLINVQVPCEARGPRVHGVRIAPSDDNQVWILQCPRSAHQGHQGRIPHQVGSISSCRGSW